MSDQIWIGILLLLSWAAFPITMILVNKDFDGGVVRPGEKADDHLHH